MATSSDKVPPVPVTTDVITPSGAPIKVGKESVPTANIFRGQKFTNTWNQWFVAVKDKIDIINASIVALSQFSGTGFISRRPDGTYVSRTISGTSGEVSVANGDGVAGNPTVGLVNTAVTPGSYGDTTHWPTFTVDSKGRLTLATNQLAPAGSSPLTTKGDLYTYSTTNARLPVGTDGFFLVADSTQTTGLRWVTAPSGTSPLTTKGDVFVYGTSNARLPVGTNGQVLTADSTQTLGMKWAAGGGGGSTPTGTGYVHVVAGVQDTAAATNIATAVDIGSFNKAGLTVPLAASFTTFGTGVTLTDKVGRLVLSQTAISGTNLSGATQTSIATPYTVDLQISLSGIPVSPQSCLGGIILSNGTSYIAFYTGNTYNSASSNLYIDRWSSTTSASNALSAMYAMTFAGTCWMRITDNGTTRTYLVSNNGLDFIIAMTEATNTFITPSSFGFTFFNQASSTVGKATIHHWLVSNSVLGDAP